jgi:hypothetical protein
MTVATTVKSRNVQVIVLDKQNNNSISLEDKTLEKNDFIRNERIILTFLDHDLTSSDITF